MSFAPALPSLSNSIAECAGESPVAAACVCLLLELAAVPTAFVLFYNIFFGFSLCSDGIAERGPPSFSFKFAVFSGDGPLNPVRLPVSRLWLSWSGLFFCLSCQTGLASSPDSSEERVRASRPTAAASSHLNAANPRQLQLAAETERLAVPRTSATAVVVTVSPDRPHPADPTVSLRDTTHRIRSFESANCVSVSHCAGNGIRRGRLLGSNISSWAFGGFNCRERACSSRIPRPCLPPAHSSFPPRQVPPFVMP